MRLVFGTPDIWVYRLCRWISFYLFSSPFPSFFFSSSITWLFLSAVCFNSFQSHILCYSAWRIRSQLLLNQLLYDFYIRSRTTLPIKHNLIQPKCISSNQSPPPFYSSGAPSLRCPQVSQCTLSRSPLLRRTFSNTHPTTSKPNPVTWYNSNSAMA